MKIYIAACANGAELERAKRMVAAARSAGLDVVCTWPEIVTTVGDANPRNATCAQREGWAAQDLREVGEADVLWFLVPTPPATTRGAWLEAGYAHALGKLLVFSGDTAQSVFAALGEEFDSDDSALEFLKVVAAERARVFGGAA
jgi:nucleoside 2-deoxyribosyltransferase